METQSIPSTMQPEATFVGGVFASAMLANESDVATLDAKQSGGDKPPKSVTKLEKKIQKKLGKLLDDMKKLENFYSGGITGKGCM